MARWRLAAPHYLMVPGTKWEYSEVDRTTGRPKRTQFDVPTLLDPENPGDWNYVYSKDGFGKPDTGEIVVAQGEHEPRDIIFNGEPTPDMVPLDDEAKAITAKFSHKWKHPIESLSGTYADEMMKDLTEQLDEVRTKAASTVQVDGMTELLTAMTAMMKQNQDLLGMIAKQAATKDAGAARRL